MKKTIETTMVRYSRLLILCLVLLVTQLAGAQQVKNPTWHRNWPDPTIWKADDGRYFCIATNPRRSLVSDDLFNWQMSDISPIDANSWATISSISRNYWAPDVAVVNGKRLMYLTLYNSAEDSNIAVLQEFAPCQFQFKGIITKGKETGIEDTIDPEVVTDPKTGKVWLFFGSVGGIHRIELNADGLSLKEGAKYEHVAGLTVHQCPDRSKVFEGSYLHWHEGYWYLFVSSGFFGNHTYQLQVGRSKKLTGEFVNREGKPMTEGYATPVLHSDKGDNFFGPGHCGEIFTAADGNEYIFYHCHIQESRRPEQRPMFMSRIQWDKDGWPFVEGGKPA
ncbi:MAG: family 43 glycosylhydrolase [Bacteroidaceae bacterium]|nr:family 43 glycosylhydrolase [Bacteroidaceae bacterium]